jgi:hypothetical protein
MRSYIFTALERQILDDWFAGRISMRDTRLQKIVSRIRLFTNLASDVTLYSKAKNRLAKSKSTFSA